MIPSFASALPSAEADATRTNEFGAKSSSPLKWTDENLIVLFRELELLARTYSSGRCWNEADRFCLSRTDIKLTELSFDIDLVLNGLLTQDSSQWQTKITDLISWFEPFPTAVTNGLVSACKELTSPLISDTTATLWHDTWRELTHHLPEYQLPLSLLTTALHYKQKPDDPRVWMELSIEERKILQQALGIDSIESRD
jgi:hypothetical protein